MPIRIRPTSALLPQTEAARAAPSIASDYVDSVIQARRRSARSVEVQGFASPAGPMPEPVMVSFGAAEAQRLHQGFCSNVATGQGGLRIRIADLSELRSVQSEIEAIVPNFLSVPVVPLINRTGKENATFASIRRRENVVKPTIRYRDLDVLLHKPRDEVVPKAEVKLEQVREGV
jgi:hypothetical protein